MWDLEIPFFPFIIMYYFIYLLCYNLNPDAAGSARINVKGREKKERQLRRAKKRKGIEAQRAKPSTPSQAIDAHMGDEEQNGKHRKNIKKDKGMKRDRGTKGETSYPYSG